MTERFLKESEKKMKMSGEGSEYPWELFEMFPGGDSHPGFWEENRIFKSENEEDPGRKF